MLSSILSGLPRSYQSLVCLCETCSVLRQRLHISGVSCPAPVLGVNRRFDASLAVLIPIRFIIRGHVRSDARSW